MKEYLKKFRLQLKIIFQEPKFPTFTYLRKEVEKIEQKFKEKIAPPEFCDFERLLSKIYILWDIERKQGLKKLNYKEKKCLPWILHKENKIINNIKLLEAILELFTPPKSFHLSALGHVYLKHFNFSQGNEVLREFIFHYLNLYQGKKKRLQQWKSKINFLFTKSAILNTGMWILAQKENNPRVCLEELGLIGELATSNFVKEVILFCLERTVENLKFLPILLKLIKSPVSFTSVRFPEILPEMATKLIPEVEKRGDKEIQETLIKFFLRYLKDPRFSDAIQWRKVSEKARKIFMQWLAQKDIEFFFEVVERTAGDINWRYRRKFWEAYLPYIEETRVFLGPKAMRLAKIWVENLEYSFGKLVGGGKNAVILMQIGEYIFSEWAPIGACRVYERSILKNKIQANSCSSLD
ncbi:MAG: hypothetical protein DRP29_10145, partial [Thermodesulfobacteriota bacterium]